MKPQSGVRRRPAAIVAARVWGAGAGPLSRALSLSYSIFDTDQRGLAARVVVCLRCSRSADSAIPTTLRFMYFLNVETSLEVLQVYRSRKYMNED